MSPVRIQWDPDRSLGLDRLERRAIQVGLSGEAVDRYLDEWIVDISDVTELAHEIHRLVVEGSLARATNLLPIEDVYPLSLDLRAKLGAG